MLSKDGYKKLLTKNIAKAYKKTSRRKDYDITNEIKSIAKDFSIENHIENMYESE